MEEADPILIVVAAVVVRDGRALLTRRNAGAHLAGHWELPGGKVEAGESPMSALVREMREELGVRCSIGPPFAFNFHAYPAVRVLLLTYRAEFEGDPRPIGCAEIGWFDASRLRGLTLPPADDPIIERLLPMLA